MKSVSCFRDLEQFGIKPLTGEADALGYRILCDLTEEGVKVFKECFGIPLFAERVGSDPNQAIYGFLGLNDNWNSGAIASVMLSEDSIRPLAVMGFYLQGKVVIVTDLGIYALEEMEDIVLDDSGDFYTYIDHDRKNNPSFHHKWRINVYGNVRRIIRPRKSDGRVVQGTRNVHQFSGRVS
jgi:hypothetical protein